MSSKKSAFRYVLGVFWHIYLKSALLMGSLYGVGMGLFYAYFAESLLAGATSALVQGLLFGGAASLWFGTLHVWRVRALPGDNDLAKLGVDTDHTRRLVLEVPRERAFELCLASVATLSGGSVTSSDRERGTIEAERSTNFFYSSARISFEVTEVAPSRTMVRVSGMIGGAPRKIVALDFGRHLDSVQQICAFLLSRATVVALPDPLATELLPDSYEAHSTLPAAREPRAALPSPDTTRDLAPTPAPARAATPVSGQRPGSPDAQGYDGSVSS